MVLCSSPSGAAATPPGGAHEQKSLAYFAHPPRGAAAKPPGGAHEQKSLAYFAHPPRGAAAKPPGGTLTPSAFGRRGRSLVVGPVSVTLGAGLLQLGLERVVADALQGTEVGTRQGGGFKSAQQHGAGAAGFLVGGLFGAQRHRGRRWRTRGVRLRLGLWLPLFGARDWPRDWARLRWALMAGWAIGQVRARRRTVPTRGAVGAVGARGPGWSVGTGGMLPRRWRRSISTTGRQRWALCLPFGLALGLHDGAATLEFGLRCIAVFCSDLAGRLAVQIKTGLGRQQGLDVRRAGGVAVQKQRQAFATERAGRTFLDVGLDAQLDRQRLARREQRRKALGQRRRAGCGRQLGHGRGCGLGCRSWCGRLRRSIRRRSSSVRRKLGHPLRRRSFDRLARLGGLRWGFLHGRHCHFNHFDRSNRVLHFLAG